MVFGLFEKKGGSQKSASVKGGDLEPFTCNAEANTWRDCLKEHDYHPDKAYEVCQGSRKAYYKCLNQWREGNGLETAKTAKAPLFSGPPQCGPAALDLHECMKVKTFDVNNCQDEMQKLRLCSAKYDPEIARLNAPDPADQLFQLRQEQEGKKLAAAIADRSDEPKNRFLFW